MHNLSIAEVTLASILMLTLYIAKAHLRDNPRFHKRLEKRRELKRNIY